MIYFSIVDDLSVACKMSLELTFSTVLILLLGSVTQFLCNGCSFSWFCGSIRFSGAVLIVILLTAISIITWYQYWVAHLGIITVQCVMFCQIFHVTLPLN